ncbi:bifunctional glutamate N-acetyltransferase/amino-acid acetyltransferase ArgJ [Anderseniella sp. Alg231-50]|uniref:bifunctional glutamate N-acetyltransferase/amino-acid acetyltransferase ArgJ n=1 Tax=Anderseniella sp. Alg231-50 TaxID=1922226 RepID=UPI000D55B1C6
MAKALPQSPLAPKSFADLPAIEGVRLATAATGVKYKGRDDLLLCVLDRGTTVAGVLTTSKTCSAPVDLCRANLQKGKVRAIVVNASNANAFTGKAGRRTVEATVAEACKVVGCDASEVYLASTGVIGEPLDPAPITARLSDLNDAAAGGAWMAAARAIMTTDTFPKLATATARLGGKTVTVNGIAKGSGMIAPDMATMLSFVFTDAGLPRALMQKMLSDAADRSFNSITVDGDTSTSDTLLLCATGKSGTAPKGIRTIDDAALKSFRSALDKVLQDLAHQTVRDGEGASKFVSITVAGAENDTAARRIGLAIANSPLVKTAIAGEDANWGRIVMAVGKSGEKADRDRLKIRIGGILVASRGSVHPGYDEDKLVPHMKGQKIDIAVDVGVGKGTATVWTCDLSHGYIDINGSYRS